MLAPGRDAVTATREPLADAVHRHVTGRLDAAQRTALRTITEVLAD